VAARGGAGEVRLPAAEGVSVRRAGPGARPAA
jgi:hypothetical protein